MYVSIQRNRELIKQSGSWVLARKFSRTMRLLGSFILEISPGWVLDLFTYFLHDVQYYDWNLGHWWVLEFFAGAPWSKLVYMYTLEVDGKSGFLFF